MFLEAMGVMGEYLELMGIACDYFAFQIPSLFFFFCCSKYLVSCCLLVVSDSMRHTPNLSLSFFLHSLLKLKLKMFLF